MNTPLRHTREIDIGHPKKGCMGQVGPIGHKEAGKTVTPWLPQQAISTLLLNGYAVLAHHVTGDRFRHGTKLVRFRPDKAPKQCTFEQIAPQTLPRSVKLLLG